MRSRTQKVEQTVAEMIEIEAQENRNADRFLISMSGILVAVGAFLAVSVWMGV